MGGSQSTTLTLYWCELADRLAIPEYPIIRTGQFDPEPTSCYPNLLTSISAQ